MNKKNDWLAANLNRPDFSMDDMFAAGITPDNTGLQDKDYYKGIKQVQEAFKNKNGEFDEALFDNYYDSVSRTYNEFSRSNFEKNLLNNMESSPYDIFALENPNTFDWTVKMVRNKDPQRHQIGMSGVNVTGDPSWDEREVAQANFVRDENGNALDWTPNDKGFWGALTGKTLVKAAWDEDGYHEENGRQVFHHKGESKYDENGDPYYELLGGRSVYGKDVLHVTDVISKDDSWANQFDFLDSDSLDKSVGKTIAKTAATIGMWAIPYVGPWLGGVKAIMDMSSVLPVVGKSIDSFISGDTDNKFGESMNKWEGFMSRFDRSQTQYAQEHQWAFENIGDMISSTAGQLYSQRLIGQIPLLFKNHFDDLGKLQKIGQGLSLGYMALTSAEDSYRTFKEAGANDVTAGLGFLGTAGTLFGLMQMDYFKDWLFKNSNIGFDPEMRYAWRQFAKEKADEITKEFEKSGLTLGKKLTKEGEKKFLGKWKDSVKEFTDKYLITGKAYPMTKVFANHALNEGIEEVTEEAFGDMIKAIALGAQELGLNVTEDNIDKLDFGFSPEEMFNRYITSFVGGAVGGAVFEGLTRWENYWRNPNADNLLDKSARNRLIWYVANGYGKDLRKALERERRNGNLGDKNLTFDFRETTDAKGDTQYVSKAATKNGDNQNEQMYRALSNMLDAIEFEAASLRILDSDDKILQAALKNDDLSTVALKNMQEAAEKEGLTLEEFKKKHLTSLSQEVMASDGVMDAIFSDVYSLKDRIFTLQSAIKNREAEIRKNETDQSRIINDERVKNDEVINELKKQQKEAQEEYKNIMEGKRASEYIGLAYFIHDNQLTQLYLNKNADDKKASNDWQLYALERYGVNYESLPDNLKDFIKTEFSAFSTAKLQPMLREAYNIHKAMMYRVNDTLTSKKAELDGHTVDTGLQDQTVFQYYSQEINKLQYILQNKKRQYEALADKTSEDAIKLHDEIDEAEKELNRLTLAVSTSDPTILRRAISLPHNKITGDNFIGALPYSFSSDYTLSLSEIKETITKANKYLDYLKSNKIIKAEDNPVVKNVLDSVARAYRQHIDSVINRYKKESNDLKLTRDYAPILDSVIELGFDVDGEGNVDSMYNTLEEGNVFEDRSDPNVKLAVELYNLKKLKALRNKLQLAEAIPSIQLTDIESAHLNNFSNIEDSELDSLIAEKTENLKQIIEGIDSINFLDRTGRAFEEQENAYPQIDGDDKLLSKITDLIETIRTNPSKIGEKVEAIKSELNAIGNDDETRQQLIDQILGDIESDTSELQALIDKEAELTPSPVADLLEWINIEIGGTQMPLIDYLRDEYKGINSREALDSYQLANQSARDQLERIQELLPIVSAIIQSSGNGGMSQVLNIYRDKDGLEELPVLSEDQMLIYVKELTYINNRINQLIALDEANVESNAELQIQAQLNMRPKFVRKFVGDVHSPGIPNRIQEEFGFDIEALWREVKGDVDLDNVTGDNYNEFFEAVIKWEKRVYEEFQKNRGELTEFELGEKIGSLFTNLVNDGGKYDADPKTEPTDMALALYFQSIVGFDRFHELNKSKFNRDENYAFDSQELAIRMAFTAFLNPGIYNGIISKVKSHSADEDGAATNLMSRLTNIITCLGENGTGKSKIVAVKVIDLLRSTGRSIGVVGTTQFGTLSEGRLSEMKEELGLDDAHTKPLAEIIALLNDGKQFGPDDYVKPQENTTYKPGKLSEDKLKSINSNKLSELYGDEDIKILVLDEGTFASEAELQALSKAASEKGIMIFITGDLNQQYRVIQYYDYDNKGNKSIAEISSGLEDCIYGATPKLTTSMRVNYRGKRNNGQKLNFEVNKYVAKFKSNPLMTTDQIIDSGDVVDIALEYHDTGKGFFGDKVVEQGDAIEYVKKFDEYSKDSKRKKPNVAIITDNESKYSALKSDNVEIYRPDDVQGREFDYAVIDVDMSKPLYSAKFTRLKGVNTWLSRARNGAVIVNKPEISASGFKFTSYDAPSAAASVDPINDRPEEINKYKDFVDEYYQSIGEYHPDEKPNPTTDSSDNGSSTSDSSEELLGVIKDVKNGFSVEPGESVEDGKQRVIKTILDNENNDDNRNGYKDNSHYRDHHKLLTDSNTRNERVNSYSLEEFWRWLMSNESDDLLFSQSPLRDDLEPDEKLRWKYALRDIVYATVTNSKNDRKNAIDNIKQQLSMLLNGLFNGVKANDWIQSLSRSISGDNNYFSVFKAVPDRKDSSMIWFVFGTNSQTFSIPIGRTTKGGLDGIYSDIDFRESIPLSIVSSNGSVHLPITHLSNKLHLHTLGGIFTPPDEESGKYAELSKEAENFRRSAGRFYNIWDLDFGAGENKTREYFTPEYDPNGRILNFTPLRPDTNTSVRLSGTHAVIEFETYVNLARTLHRWTFGYGEEISPEQEAQDRGFLLKNLGLSEDELDILHSKSENPTKQSKYNSNRYKILREHALLERGARAKLASAIFRLAGNWWNSEDENQRNFSSAFWSNLVSNYILNGGDPHTSETGAGKYLYGLKLIINGFNPNTSAKTELEVFVYAGSNGQLNVELAKNRNHSDESKTILNIGLTKDLLDADKGINMYRLAALVINALRENSSDENILLDKNYYKDAYDSKSVDSPDYENNFAELFSKGTIAFLPSKRLERKRKEKNQTDIVYFDGFDSDIAALIPENNNKIYDKIQLALVEDPIFKYGMYVYEHSSEAAVDSENNVFWLKNPSTGGKHTTDIVDAMLPAYEIEHGLQEETDENILRTVGKLGDMGMQIEGREGNGNISAKLDNNEYTFLGGEGIIVTGEQLSEIAKNDKISNTESITIKKISVEEQKLRLSIVKANGSQSILTLDKNNKDIRTWLLETVKVSKLEETGAMSLSDDKKNGYIYWNGTELSFRYKDGKGNDRSSELDVIGWSESRQNGNIDVWVSTSDGIQKVSLNMSTLIDGDAKIALIKVLENQQNGAFITQDLNGGYYFFKDGNVVYKERLSDTSEQRLGIREKTNDRIIFSDGTYFDRNDDPDLFDAISSTQDVPITRNNVKLYKHNNVIYVNGNLTINGAYLSSNFNLFDVDENRIDSNGKSMKVISISSNGRQLSLLDENNNTVIAKWDNDFVSMFLSDVSASTIRTRISKLLDRDDLSEFAEEVLTQISDYLDQPESSIIAALNKYFVDNMIRIGHHYELDKNFRLSTKDSIEDKMLIEIGNYDFGDGVVDYESIEISGKSANFLVTLQNPKDTILYVAKMNDKNEIEIDIADQNEANEKQISIANKAISDLENQISEAKNIGTDVSELEVGVANLKQFLENWMYNRSNSDELDAWIYDNSNNPTFASTINEIYKVEPKAC